eukprot:jgi/Picsp_1/2901/NSC_01126-R1_protein
MSAGQQHARVCGNKQKRKKAQIEEDEIQEIELILESQKPSSGCDTAALSAKSAGDSQGFATARKFEDLPISRYTKDALRKSKFVTMTAIQRAAVPHALVGRDVLGAAKTGSGKTLAFLIPTIEKLYRLKWNIYDGLGALIISPTRELALQIFEELRTIGSGHDLSAGLLIGGKDVEQEASRIGSMNILVATPGRLLQHMDESPDFNADNLQALVLDEADRILDMGFSATVNAIIANLPRQRQTLLFSATQTKSVSALARLSLRDPEYVSAHAEASAPTPVKLEQAYMICNLQDKMDVVWSFIKTHLSSRMIIFFSTCKQVKFVYEAFRRLRPGTPLRCLHGRMSQQKRVVVYQQFCESKAGVLFATDIAARGLDFPAVDWVVQADCPEDVAAYIHRVGRTARYVNSGKGLLLLLPSEQEGMMEALKEAKVQLKCLKYNKEKIQPVSPSLQALLSKDASVKETAQKSLICYLKSVFLQPRKNIFDVSKLPAAEYALSLGLTTVPKLKMLTSDQKSKIREMEEYHDDHDDNSNEEGNGTAVNDTGGDDFLVVKRKHHEIDDVVPEASPSLQNTTSGNSLKKKKKKMKIDAHKTSGTKVIFDEEGNALDPLEALAGNIAEEEKDFKTVEERAVAAQRLLQERDTQDKEAIKQLRKAKRDAKRAKRLAREREESHGDVVLGDQEQYSSDASGSLDALHEPEVYGGERKETAHFGMVSTSAGERGDASQDIAAKEAAVLQLIRSSTGSG